MTPGPKSLALVREAETTTALPAEGISMILRPGWARSGGAPAWTCLASGTERLMKLTIGLTAEADGNPWPTAKIRQVNGHRLATLRPDVDRALGERISGVAAPSYIRELADRVTDDHYLPLIFEALAQWSESSGRYRDFNILGGENVEGHGPSSAWESAEQRVLLDRPDLLATPAGANSHSAQAQQHALVAASVVCWWFLHYGPGSMALSVRSQGSTRAVSTRGLWPSLAPSPWRR